MSLELALERTTAVMERLIAVLTETVPQPVHVHLNGDFPPSPEDNMRDIVHPDVEIAPAKKTRAKKEAQAEAPKGEPASEQTAPSPEAGATDASETEAAAAQSEPTTYADAAAATTRLIKARGTPFAKEALSKFGVTNTQGLAPDAWDAWIAAVDAVLK